MAKKEFSLCHKLLLNTNQWRRHLIFQTKNSVRSNNLSLKYQRLTPTPSGCKDKDIVKIKHFSKSIYSVTKILLFFNH